ncbi:response regulator [Sneathiella sp. P13V-1]|uniref:chemotaxis protein CheB n=1 Tax=Sneathiella sp. P13V-1 TaxID=2697366 RepID=UPI00187B64FB|nr:chemotaxis protein CheB [Sneathiella sp. P13V-1]MBE7637792.1 response regulator [Sneathiella sp. P13V-1]
MRKKAPPSKLTPLPRSKKSNALTSEQSGSTSHYSVVAIGASAGGLDACKKFLQALPAETRMAYLLVQHLDPTHESLLVDLLGSHTSLKVVQAKNDMSLRPDHLYIIPPGYYLSLAGDVLKLTLPQEGNSTRLPFDYLLSSMAEVYGSRAMCVVLSGTGNDGSTGLRAINENNGLVIAQEPEDAEYDGMPRSAIMTGLVDIVLPVDKIPAAILRFDQQISTGDIQVGLSEIDFLESWLPEIVNLLRTRTSYNFSQYKTGTIQRRIERRIGISNVEGDVSRYLEILRSDPDELEHLANDLLINVTSFFRDVEVFDSLVRDIIPKIVANKVSGQPVRIWSAGCSTGQEAYSLAMLFLEEIAASGHDIKLQVFASDVDPDAIAQAREGLYPDAIEAELTPARLNRFFVKEDHSYRVTEELRSTVIFTVHDVLGDPPFSRLDFVSCRNLLIYLEPAAQTKIISVFHFSLHKNGVLLLGGSESINITDKRFAVISKTYGLYRHVVHRQTSKVQIPVRNTFNIQPVVQSKQDKKTSPQAGLADIYQRLVLENYAPAVVLINRKFEILYSLGPTDRYLRVASGLPTQDLFAMIRPTLRTKLRSAVHRSIETNRLITIDGGTTDQGERFNIIVEPVLNEDDELLLVCFKEPSNDTMADVGAAAKEVTPRELKLELELKETRAELEGAIRNLEESNAEQITLNHEIKSASEEYQSTNEELLTSKEELQSLNEELTALNNQLQEALDQQRTTSNDLQNVLFSTDVATLFLDRNFNIRFFTPAIKSLFNLIAGDIGRPLRDLNTLISNDILLADAQTVLQREEAFEREIVTKKGDWYVIRVFPYRAQSDLVAGVVITFVDITERKQTSMELEATKSRAELANEAKSRFLSAASHDLRQPLQTLALLQGILAKLVEGAPAKKLLGRMEETLGAMSGMLNALLDINQIDAGTVKVDKIDFPIAEMLDRLSSEFGYHAQAQGLAFRTVPSNLYIHSDQRLLEQMIRNLLANAIKYTKKGKILLGCRRHGNTLSIQVWDTGIGIPEGEYKAIFEEYHQINNEARERRLGLGLGLSIVQRLGELLGHSLHVRSLPSKGSVFSVDVLIATEIPNLTKNIFGANKEREQKGSACRAGKILIVEDDPDVLDLLELLLSTEGYETMTAQDGVLAAKLPVHGDDQPDLIISDFNLPKGVNGLELVENTRERIGLSIPAIILTGDISTSTLRLIAGHDCLKLDKPVNPEDLLQSIQNLLASSHLEKSSSQKPVDYEPDLPLIFVVDDDSHIREAVQELFVDKGRGVEVFETAEAFLETYRSGHQACLLIDAFLPGMSGVELLEVLKEKNAQLPTIVITGNGDVAMAVQAMKAGALDFIEKPLDPNKLITSVERALDLSQNEVKLSEFQDDAIRRIEGLTTRQRQIMELVLAGQPSKNIAADLGISQRTVENHRAAVMTKTETKSLPELARLAITAGRKLKNSGKKTTKKEPKA